MPLSEPNEALQAGTATEWLDSGHWRAQQQEAPSQAMRRREGCLQRHIIPGSPVRTHQDLLIASNVQEVE